MSARSHERSSAGGVSVNLRVLPYDPLGTKVTPDLLSEATYVMSTISQDPTHILHWADELDPDLRSALRTVLPDGSTAPMFPDLQRKARKPAEVSVTFRRVSDLSAHMRKVFDEIRSDTRTYGTQVMFNMISVVLEYDESFGCWVLIMKENGTTLITPESFLSNEEMIRHFRGKILPVLYDRERSYAPYDPDI